MQRLRHSLFALLTVALLLAGGCGDQSQEPVTAPDAVGALSKQQDQPGLERALAAKERHVARLMQNEDIVGAGVGLTADGDPAVVVLTARALGAAHIPSQLDGVPVVEMVTGRITAFQAQPQVKPSKPGKPGTGTTIDPKAWFTRPVPIGVSTSNITDVCAAGTIGCRILINGEPFMLSNNHVLAKERTTDGSGGSEGIVQPGRYDDGCAVNQGNVIATLSRWIGIKPTGNLVDAAVASTNNSSLGNGTPSDGYGIPSSTIIQNPTVGTYVLKYGRTTGQTRGQISAVSVTVNVGYTGFTAEFTDQILISAVKGGSFSKAGDSGSLIVTDESPYHPVGLLFAGSSRVTVANKISHVLNAFGSNVTIDGN